MSTPNEQFEILANSLRIFPERIIHLSYYVDQVKDPEEGISNIESAFRDVLNQFYGMMSALKEGNLISSLYEHTAITSLLCLRHVVQHHSGIVRNLFRDVILNKTTFEPFQIEYSTSDKERGRGPFPISVTWYEETIKKSNYANKWNKIEQYWNLKTLKQEAKLLSIPWDNVYVDATSLITEAVYELCKEYKEHFSPSGYDSEVYYEHFCNVRPFNKGDFALIA